MITRNSFILWGFVFIIVGFFLTGFYLGWKLKPRVTDYYTVTKPVTVIKTRILTKIKYRTKIKTKVIYVPPEGSVEIKPKDPGKKLEDVVEVKVKWYGLTFKPGFQTGFVTMGLGLDFKLAYVNRFGFNIGALLQPKGMVGVSPSLGLSYRLDRIKFIDNTEVMCAYTPLSPIPVNCGLRINL